MATTKIKGITLEIGGDTTGLEKALKDVNAETKTTEKQLKEVEKLLKLDPTNTDLLAQKQTLLAQKVENTEKKLDTLKKTQEAFVKQGGDITSAGYIALQQEIKETEVALESARKASDSFSISVAKAQPELGKVADKAQLVADKTRLMSKAAAGALAGITAAGVKAARTADELNTLAKQTGFSTDELQKFQYASELVDVSMSDIESAVKRLKKNLDSTTLQKLGVEARDASGEFRNINDIFYDTLDALSRIENETERDKLAMDIFGKSADSLAGIVDDGGAALKEFGDEAANLGLIMGEDTLSELNEFNDTLDKLKGQATGTLIKAAAKALEALQPVLEKVINAVSRLLEWIGGLNEKQVSMVLTILAVVAAISPIAGIISGIASAISLLLPLLATLAGPAGLIAVIVGAVVAAVVLIRNHFDEIKAKLAEFKEAFINAFSGLVEIAKIPINGIITLMNRMIARVNGLIDRINSIGDAFRSLGINLPTIGNLKEIPLLASGGVLTGGSAIVGEAGAELLTVAHGQAVVRPLTSGGGGGGITVNMNNTFNGYTSAQGAAASRDLVRQINRALGSAY